MAGHVFRIHPAIGVARVGSSDEFLLSAETISGLEIKAGSDEVGGLPIRPGTEADRINSDDLRDAKGALKRQGVRFRIFAYDGAHAAAYPTGRGAEVRIGSTVDGKRVADIVWTAHLANKKANAYVFNGDLGLDLYSPGNAARLTVRNPAEGGDLGDAARRKRLVIDPGPRAVRGCNAAAAPFDKATPACYGAGASVVSVNNYPKSFPDDSFSPLNEPAGKIATLGDIRTDEHGRLILLGGYGRAVGWSRADGSFYPLATGEIAPGVIADLNEDGWFDDNADGPVSATLVFADGSVEEVHGAWAVVAPPNLAPQCLNVVTLWDDVLDTWVRKLDLSPEIYGQDFVGGYAPYFDVEIHPMFRAAALQQWNVNLPPSAVDAHNSVGAIKASDKPDPGLMQVIRKPGDASQSTTGSPLMPLSMGDAGKAFLTVTLTQHFFLTQWSKGQFRATPKPALGHGEALDKVSLANCMGGAFGPGLEMTFVIRDPGFYQADWRTTGAGPFRIRGKRLDYKQAQAGQPFLGVGYVPNREGALEPGDVTKYMSLPWHTDYNACATHNQDPNPNKDRTLYWAWPAQRPSHVRRARDVSNGALGPWRYFFRGEGTYSDDLGTAGRYQDYVGMVVNWPKLGTVMQGTAIAKASFSAAQYLETQSLLDEPEIAPWPMQSEHPDE